MTILAFTPRAAARRNAAALSLLLLALGAPQAADAATISHFQQHDSLSCGSGTCRADFIDLPPNQALDVEKVWCEVYTTGTVWRGWIYSQPIEPYFTIPLELEWVRLAGGNTTKIYQLSVDAGMRVPLGRQLRVSLEYAGGSPIGSCSFVGQRITQ